MWPFASSSQPNIIEFLDKTWQPFFHDHDCYWKENDVELWLKYCFVERDFNDYISYIIYCVLVHRLMTFIFLVLLFLFYHIFAYLERTPLTYFSTFAIKFLHWPVKDVSPLMSLFFGTHCAGRFLGVPLSLVLRPRTMIVINLLITAVAYIILLPIRTELLWASAALSGLGMATTFATALLWAAESVAITGRVSSFAVAGGSIGYVVQPQVVGQLFDVPSAGGPMSMVYLLVSAAFLHIVLFACMVAFVVRCLKNHYPTVQETLVNPPTSTQHDIEHWCCVMWTILMQWYFNFRINFSFRFYLVGSDIIPDLVLVLVIVSVWNNTC